MARLVTIDAKGRQEVFELKLGPNRFGRGPEADFQLEHATVSTLHCEIELADGAVVLRDCNSTNGTFVNGEPVKEAVLRTGQTVHIGDVELYVESTEITVAIPKYDRELPAPPVVRKDGSMQCQRHPQATVTHRCTHCHEVMCGSCVHRLRRRGGKVLLLCPLCSSPVEVLGAAKKKKKSLLGMLAKTIKIPFFHAHKPKED